jgi:hypothetical protein
MPSPYPLSDPTAPPSVDDVDVMKKWLEVGLKPGYKKTNVKIKYNDFEESLSPSWDFRDVCISSKTWFYTLWTAEEWLTDEVSFFDIHVNKQKCLLTFMSINNLIYIYSFQEII